MDEILYALYLDMLIWDGIVFDIIEDDDGNFEICVECIGYKSYRTLK